MAKKKGVALDAKTNDGFTALMDATANSSDCVPGLIALGADINTGDVHADGRTALHFAVWETTFRRPSRVYGRM